MVLQIENTKHIILEALYVKFSKIKTEFKHCMLISFSLI